MATPTVYVICDQNCKFESLTKEQIYAAITQAVNEGTIGDCDTGFITTIKTINNVPLRFFYGDQSTYDALPAEEKTNLYAIITNDTSIKGINEAIERLQTNYDELYNGLVNGSFLPKKAESATYDSLGNNIQGTYQRAVDGVKRIFVTPQTSWNSGFNGRVRITWLPEGKTISDIAMLSIEVYEPYYKKKGYYYAIRNWGISTSTHGHYMDFVCQYADTADNTDYYESSTLSVRIYDINGEMYITRESVNGIIVQQSDKTIFAKNGWVMGLEIKTVCLFFS